MKVPLPPTIVSAIATVRWPLTAPSMPMYYEPISSLKKLRQPNSIPPNLRPLMEISDILDGLSLNIDSHDKFDGKSKRNYSSLALALIFLGNGLQDECHDLITPLSWQEDTYFGGPTLCSSVEGDVVALASYVHSLLHRREAFAMGEFGMIGFQNANYWASATKAREANDNLPYEEVRREVLKVSKEYGDEAKQWCNERILKEREGDENYWEIRSLHELCASVLRDENSFGEMKAFAERASEIELRVLLKCCLERAGFDCGDCLWREMNDNGANGGNDDISHRETNIEGQSEGNVVVDIDSDVAQGIANKISSAHLGAFQSSGSVTLRNVWMGSFDPVDNRLTIAAGLACRLLASPAVTTVTNRVDNDTGVQIILPSNESESAELLSTMERQAGNSFYGGGAVAVGDAFATIIKANEVVTGTNGSFFFLPADKSSSEVIFADRFHGTRGETPTSVLQWSKGTIHVSNQ